MITQVLSNFFIAVIYIFLHPSFLNIIQYHNNIFMLIENK